MPHVHRLYRTSGSCQKPHIPQRLTTHQETACNLQLHSIAKTPATSSCHTSQPRGRLAHACFS